MCIFKIIENVSQLALWGSILLIDIPNTLISTCNHSVCDALPRRVPQGKVCKHTIYITLLAWGGRRLLYYIVRGWFAIFWFVCDAALRGDFRRGAWLLTSFFVMGSLAAMFVTDLPLIPQNGLGGKRSRHGGPALRSKSNPIVRRRRWKWSQN
jgi:hypothetical protein